MSKPIDLKTVKIFEPLKRKPELKVSKETVFNSEIIYETLSKYSNEIVNLLSLIHI